MKMTKEEINSAYLEWAKSKDLSPVNDIFANPIRDFDEIEDEFSSRLYYAVSHFENEHMTLFLFYEETAFAKDENGEFIPAEVYYDVAKPVCDEPCLSHVLKYGPPSPYLDDAFRRYCKHYFHQDRG